MLVMHMLGLARGRLIAASVEQERRLPHKNEAHQPEESGY